MATDDTTDTTWWPDRRDFLKLSAAAGTTLAVGLVGASEAGASPGVSLDRGRVRPGAEVEVEVSPLPSGTLAVPIHIVEVDAEGRPLEVLQTLQATGQGGSARATFTAVGRRGVDAYAVCGVLVVEGGRTIRSAPVEIICTMQLPGI